MLLLIKLLLLLPPYERLATLPNSGLGGTDHNTRNGFSIWEGSGKCPITRKIWVSFMIGMGKIIFKLFVKFVPLCDPLFLLLVQ